MTKHYMDAQTLFTYICIFVMVFIHTVFVICILGVSFNIFFVNYKWINYLTQINYGMEWIVCIYLLYRFNPLVRHVIIHEHDRVFIFWSAWILALNLGIVKVLNNIPAINYFYKKYDQSINKIKNSSSSPKTQNNE